MAQKHLLTASDLRADGRKTNEMRMPSVLFDVLGEHHTSVRYTAGGTQVIAALTRRTAPSEELLPITVETLATVPGGMSLRRQIKDFLEAPLLQVYDGASDVASAPQKSSLHTMALSFLVTSSDGSAAPAALNAAIILLTYAGIPLWYVPVGLCIALYRAPLSQAAASDTLVLDPTLAEQQLCATHLEVVLDPLTSEVVVIVGCSSVHPKELSRMLGMALMGAREFAKFYADLCRGTLADSGHCTGVISVPDTAADAVNDAVELVNSI